MKALLVFWGLHLAGWWVVESGIAWSTVGIGAGLLLLALLVGAAVEVVGKALAQRRERSGMPAKEALEGWKSTLVAAVQVCAVLTPSTAIGTVLYVQHQQSCQPTRVDAAQLEALERQTSQNALGDIKSAGLRRDTAVEQDSATVNQAALAYAAIVFATPACFNDDQLAVAHSATVAYGRPADDETTAALYCWDTGPLRPHHFGHPAVGDHLCTYGELRRIGLFR
ncbi:hypothetical protein P3T37_005913 [Kitasatospora sp. MAA4]|uniref:hypothetical protein n=1 Tax=Kitasatospora sp. MAA4 TaxID=3035093 RepID=UPI00247413EC|nr:hypothetical protein [Kitasatospora sp. MAA4]MDH6136485.1 hypothetical protein [Kitasatospora sp. MAA4]